MKKIIHYILNGDPDENPWDWFLKVAVPFYFGLALFGMFVIWPIFL